MSIIIHRDKLGSVIHVGEYVAASYKNKISICKVINLSAVMIRVRDVTCDPAKPGRLVFPNETVILNESDVLAYILRA